MQTPEKVSGTSPTQSGSYGPAMAVVTLLFFMWGFLTCLNDILVPHFKIIFDLNYAQVMFIQLAFFAAYFVMSIPSGKIVARIGYKRGIVAGLLTSALGALLFYPAAGIPSYPLFLAALFILASGITMLQVTANPYVAVLGPPRTASSRLNLTQGFNSLGHTLGPVFGGIFILAGAFLTQEQVRLLPSAEQAAYRLQEAGYVQGPYIGLAATLAVLAIVMGAFKLPVIATVEDSSAKSARLRDALAHRHLVLGALAIFLYVGAEVAIGSFLVNFFSERSIGALSPAVAASYVSYYWGSAMVGRFIGSALLQKFNPRVMLAVAASVASALVLVTIASSGHTAMWTIIAVGFFNSVMFPIIFTLGVDGLGNLTSQGSSVLVMAIVGGAVIPVLQGVLADAVGIHVAFILPAVCYLYVVYYGLRGSRHSLGANPV
ncbi:MAG TPA: L-fucose:H+ symporter permease [Bacteroidota bacterium]|nr:L-fucose:H+ symporter permease [Bacteroidota bacterium]